MWKYANGQSWGEEHTLIAFHFIRVGYCRSMHLVQNWLTHEIKQNYLRQEIACFLGGHNNEQLKDAQFTNRFFRRSQVARRTMHNLCSTYWCSLRELMTDRLNSSTNLQVPKLAFVVQVQTCGMRKRDSRWCWRSLTKEKPHRPHAHHSAR